MNNNCIGSLKVTLVNIIELGRNEYMNSVIFEGNPDLIGKNTIY